MGWVLGSPGGGVGAWGMPFTPLSLSLSASLPGLLPRQPELSDCRLEGPGRSAEMLRPPSWLEAGLAAVVALGLLLALARHLWALRWSLSRDRASALPLPHGSMGWPFFGETLHWLVQVSPGRAGVGGQERDWGLDTGTLPMLRVPAACGSDPATSLGTLAGTGGDQGPGSVHLPAASLDAGRRCLGEREALCAWRGGEKLASGGPLSA